MPAKRPLPVTAVLAALAAILVGAAVLALSIGAEANRTLAARTLADLDADLRQLQAAAKRDGAEALARRIGEIEEASPALRFALVSAEGRRIAGQLAPVELPPPSVMRLPTRDGQPRLHALRMLTLEQPQRFLIAARNIEDQRALARRIQWTTIAGAGLLSALVLGAGLVVRRRLLNRIDAIAATSQAIMEGQLDERIPREGGGGELDQLSGQLNAMLDRIDGLVRALGDVSDNIAHDLKTPLSRLRLTAEAALREPAATHADALSRIIEEADGLISTFNAMLLIAKLERGTPAPALETIDMAALVADTADLYGPVVEDAGARLQVGAAPDAFVSGNRQLLAQALANLIDNAIKYGAEGQAETPAIVLTVHADAGRVRIEVADRGPGIAAADRERALRRFVRLESSRTKPGTGLGLSLVAAIVRLHHGTLTLADNEPGLRVTIDLPAAAPPHATHAPRVRDVSADAG